MCDNLAYDPKPGDTEVRTNRLCCTVYYEALNNLCEMLNLSLIVLQPVFPLCDYKVWIDTERGEEEKNHLRHMVELNLMEKEFRARRTAECRRAVFFARQCEIDREEYKEK
jgi:hypothetical protein